MRFLLFIIITALIGLFSSANADEYQIAQNRLDGEKVKFLLVANKIYIQDKRGRRIGTIHLKSDFSSTITVTKNTRLVRVKLPDGRIRYYPVEIER